MIGQALWRIKPDFAIEDGLEVAFAPGFTVPDEFVEDVKRMTYSAYDDSHEAYDYYTAKSRSPSVEPRWAMPLLAIMGAEEQIANDPSEALAAYRDLPGAETKLIAGAGHSPNVEKPAETAALVLDFAPAKSPATKPHPGTNCKNACRIRKASEGVPRFEPMFDSKTNLTARLADAVDLLIDFATLGEYGLEPAGRPGPSCESRHRPQPARGRRRGAAPTAASPPATEVAWRAPIGGTSPCAGGSSVVLVAARDRRWSAGISPPSSLVPDHSRLVRRRRGRGGRPPAGSCSTNRSDSDARASTGSTGRAATPWSARSSARRGPVTRRSANARLPRSRLEAGLESNVYSGPARSPGLPFRTSRCPMNSARCRPGSSPPQATPGRSSYTAINDDLR